ncbi:transcription termination/antitermination NusG family protein [Rhizobium sp. Leaf386]|uniref:transcription termination/antitermination NusG family protein n=1 Tax=Rhizobium sp. Leaf386 TaxID=1736359 RepID=UPI00071275FF|nr:transcription termination/antitermination NusG family protein [Rhizobium sp. Leaf386]KQS84139.1 hypothetical protein ASG50_30085 [Rhizobium sp. Leaf386]
MQHLQKTVKPIGAQAGFAVVIPDSMAGWKMIDQGFTLDRSAAAVRAAGFDKGRVLAAVQEEQEITTVTTAVQTHYAVTVDWQSLSLSDERAEQWYVVRVAPGAQKVAAKVHDAPEYRVAETIVERNLREKGVDVYMPAFWQEKRLHRGGKLRSRRLPFLVGYAFIRRNPALGFEAIRKIEGVIDVVSFAERPMVISEEDVRFLMITMFDRHQSFLFQKAQNIEEARFKRRQKLNADLGRHLPKGRGRTVSLRTYANECMGNLPKAARKRVLGIISAIDGLEDDAALDEFRKSVYFPNRDD